MNYIKMFLQLLIISMITSGISISQTTFTKITTGPVVNDGGVSFGSSWCDYDNDGCADLFVGNMSNAAGQRNFLYHNNRDGSFTKITSGSIVNDSGKSFGGTWGDYDNDGRPDLHVANFNGQVEFLYHNDGDGNFTRITSGIIVTEGGNSNSSSWLDLNNDGWLDMCVTNYSQARYLYSNNGDGTFTKITTGNFVTDVSPSLTSNWGDYNNDGRLDVFVANAGQIAWPNFFYENENNTLTKITNLNISIDTGKSFAGSWGDYNNDGYVDLFVTNTEFRNNYLYKNNGNETFTKITTGSIATEGSYSSCGTWADFNNDGWLDLFVSRWQNQNEFLYFNNGDETFAKITTGDIVNSQGNSFGSCVADYDNDGDLDLFVANINNENNFLYRNNATSENQNKWINIKCVGTTSNKSALGARIKVHAMISGNSIRQIRDISGQMGYNGQNDMRAHFGLGNAAQIDSIIVNWPSGNVNTFSNINTNQSVTITENGGIVFINEKKTEVANDFYLYQNYPNPFNPKTIIRYSFQSNIRRQTSDVKLIVYNSLGKKILTLVDGNQFAGTYSVEWDASEFSSGLYFCKLNVGSGLVMVRKMALVK